MTTKHTTQPQLPRLDRHTAYSDPGPYAALLAAVPTEPSALSAVARNVIVHYRHSGHVLPETTRGDVHARWVARTLELDQERHGLPLDVTRGPDRRVQGCCRDHTLFCCAVLREHGIEARGRVGFAGYLGEGYHYDHVVVEVREGGRWRRFDPEVPEPGARVASPMDLPTGPDSPFLTAAETWLGCRSGDLDLNRFGTGPGVLPEGPWFMQNYVLREVAHRHGDELLLWDVWGAMAAPGVPIDDAVLALTDEVAALLVAADAEESAGEVTGAAERLAQRYATDERLHPGNRVLRFDPFAGPEDPPVEESLCPEVLSGR